MWASRNSARAVLRAMADRHRSGVLARFLPPANESMPASAKRVAVKKAASTKPAKHRSRPASGLAKLPEWNLADLYAGLDDPRVARDLDRADAESLAFEEAYKGKLAALAQRPQAGPAR